MAAGKPITPRWTWAHRESSGPQIGRILVCHQELRQGWLYDFLEAECPFNSLSLMRTLLQNSVRCFKKICFFTVSLKLGPTSSLNSTLRGPRPTQLKIPTPEPAWTRRVCGIQDTVGSPIRLVHFVVTSSFRQCQELLFHDQSLHGGKRKMHHFCFYPRIPGKIAVSCFFKVMPLFDVVFSVK